MTIQTQSFPSAAVIRRALLEFKIPSFDDQVLQIQQYIRILLVWNEKINLTAIRDPLEILYRHFCESMFAAEAIPLKNGRLADIGSGGGFPGLPLKIMRPGLQVFLVESNIKKVTFLAEVIRELGLNGAQVLARRYEELGEEVAPLDYVCTRALGEFPAFLEWATSEQIAAKQVILWIGGRDLEEIQKIRSWDWSEPIEVPHSLRRLILLGTRKSSTTVAHRLKS
ncbi:MAG: 16S rRNA (guanine(527)-N(7))-methyltransferase RsmG [Acidobacteria bacterium]|nr:MAG: 16S rRNA (guanine(527)-N(7))-methyltransferase RsmG [Acidobacteriota bacterium]